LGPRAVNSEPVQQQSQQHSSCDAQSPSIPEIHLLVPEIGMDVLWVLFSMQQIGGYDQVSGAGIG